MRTRITITCVFLLATCGYAPCLAANALPPAEVSQVLVDKSGVDVVIAWDNVTTDIVGAPKTIVNYRVYAGTMANYLPDRTGGTNLLGSPVANGFTHTDALTAPDDFFYLVSAVDDLGFEGNTRTPKVRTPSIVALGHGSGVATLDWTAAQPVAQFGGSVVLWGTTSSFYENRIDLGPVTSQMITLPTVDGDFFFTVLGVDLEGNVSLPAREASLQLVSTGGQPPTISSTTTPAPNANGWNNTDVTVDFVCDVPMICPASTVVTSEGAGQVISGTATDASGNSASVSVNVNIDKTPPTLATNVTPLPNAAGWNNTEVTVLALCTDALSGVDVCPVGFVAATEGANQDFMVSAIDLAGNSTDDTITLSIDLTAPTVTAMSSPSPNANGWNDSDVTVSFNCTDALSGVVTCDPQTTVTTEGREQIILGTGTDLADNIGGVTTSISLDKTAPQISILEPSSGLAIVNMPDIVVSYDDNLDIDTGALSFMANGGALGTTCNTGATGATCSPTSALPEGSNTLDASIADLAGNAAVAQTMFNVDSLPPAVQIDQPADGLITMDSSILVNGTIGTGVATVSVNGVAASLGASSFSATVPLREGVNMIVALATKTSGRTAISFVEVTRDIEPPIVRITSPAAGFVATANTVGVTGQVNDIVSGGIKPTVFVNGVQATVAGGSFMVPSLTLVPGPNTIQAVATDAAGNQGMHSIGVSFQQPAGLRLVATSGNGQAAAVNQLLPNPLVVSVRDTVGNPVAGRLVRFRVTRNSGTVQAGAASPAARVLEVPTNGSGQASVLFKLGDTAGEGNNRVTATAVGVAGTVEFCAGALPAPPDKVLMVSGDNQRGAVGQPLEQPLEALVIDVDGNPVEGASVLFEVLSGGGQFSGQSTTTRISNADGLARAVLTLGPSAGVNNNRATARLIGLTTLSASFTASGLLPGDPANTRFKGVVLDNGLTPIPGAVVTVIGSAAMAVTDSEGQFLLTGVPVGAILLDIDPSGSPRPETFPHLEFETITVAGQLNDLGQPILIPPLDLPNSQVVGGPQDVTLNMEGVEGLELTVFANSVTFPGGSPTGVLTISQVHLDKVPMPPPSGTFFMPPAWTIQPAGVKFDPPARISIPNDGLAPGRVIDIFQFDHTLFEFINVGKGTVSDDARVIVSDPGFGITRAGWGGCGQPQPPTTCANGCDDGDICTDDMCVNGSCQHTPTANPPQQITNLDDCPNRGPKPGHMPSTNGCGPQGGPDLVPENPTLVIDGCLAGPSFTPACDTHDVCYGTCNASKGGCDLDFFADMSQICLTSVSCVLTLCINGASCVVECLENAAIYAAAVGIFGGGPYESGQKEACICCP